MVTVHWLTRWSGTKGLRLRLGKLIPGSYMSSLVDTNWITVDPGPVTKGDTSKWPYSVPILVKIVAFLSTLRCPEGLNEMGKFGISYFELLTLFERWVGRRLLPEKTVPISLRVGRSLSPGALLFSKVVQISAGCKFIGSLFRSLAGLPRDRN